jgi:DNA polymerase-3 subunit gamma/tau
MLVKRKSLNGSNDLNTVYRPCSADEFLGNDINKRVVKNNLDSNKVPHTQLFTGQPGCGKTTMARIVALGLNCQSGSGPTSTPCMECTSCKSIINRNSVDVIECNVARAGGKDAAESIVKDLPSAPFMSRSKVIIFDEAHELTDAAKNLLLKDMEDGYSHVYFIFCTNKPEALESKKKEEGNAFLDRCKRMHFDPLSTNEVLEMLINVVEYEGENYDVDILTFIAEETKGVPRKALMLLNDVINEKSWTMESTKQLLGVLIDEENPEVIELSRAMFSGKFRQANELFESLSKKYPVEALRIAVAGYFVGCLKKAGSIPEGKIYSNILDIVTTPIYQAGKPGMHIFYNYIFKVVENIQRKR